MATYTAEQTGSGLAEAAARSSPRRACLAVVFRSCQIEPMVPTVAEPRIRRPWTAMAAVFTAAHHGFELSNGIGLVWQPELGLVGASGLWGTQIPIWISLAARGTKRWDRLLAAWSGATLGAALVHFLLWPSSRGKLGLPVLTQAEGLRTSRLPAYNTLLYLWATVSALSIVREIPRRDRPWALVGLATVPLLRRSAQHHFSWLTEQAVTNPAWWNSGVRQDSEMAPFISAPADQVH